MNNIINKVKIEYSDVLPAFYCGLTAFSNLLQRFGAFICLPSGCGLTAFSNLLQLICRLIMLELLLRLDRIF